MKTLSNLCLGIYDDQLFYTIHRQGFDIDDDVVVSHGQSLIALGKHGSALSFLKREIAIAFFFVCIAFVLWLRRSRRQGYRKLADDYSVEMQA
jgi:hypothetical protein